jgi:hypothetical protein
MISVARGERGESTNPFPGTHLLANNLTWAAKPEEAPHQIAKTTFYNYPNTTLSMSKFGIKPLKLRSQRHVDTIPLDIQRIAILESENEKLRTEVQYLRSQHEIFTNRIQRYHQIAEATKAWARDAMQGVKVMHVALSNMDMAGRAVDGITLESQSMIGNWL